MEPKSPSPEPCGGCVYYPPNLPPELYSEEDYRMLQAKRCSFDATPGDETCEAVRKGACRYVSLDE